MTNKPDIEIATPQIIVEILEYVPSATVTKTILKKTTGHVSVMSCDTGECLQEKIAPFDTFVQVIDGEAEVIIEKKVHLLKTGQGMVIPAHRSNTINANHRFKMLLTLIKSGYEGGY